MTFFVCKLNNFKQDFIILCQNITPYLCFIIVLNSKQGSYKMLGYFRPCKKELTKADLYEYNLVYCTICKNLKEKYGLCSTSMIQHEIVFIYSCCYLSNKAEGFDHRVEKTTVKCIVNPFKKVDIINSQDHIFNKLADISVFTIFVSFLDNFVDGDTPGIKESFLLRFFNQTFRKNLIAMEDYGCDGKALSELTNKLQAEKLKTHHPDYAIHDICNFYTEIMSQVFADIKIKKFPTLVYNICEIMYYIDALEDFHKDRKKEKHNILISLNLNREDMIFHVENKVYLSLLNILCALDTDVRQNSIIDAVLNKSIPLFLQRATQLYLKG